LFRKKVCTKVRSIVPSTLVYSVPTTLTDLSVPEHVRQAQGSTRHRVLVVRETANFWLDASVSVT